MIERDLELTLHDLAEVHVRHEAPADVREDTRLVPLTVAERRSWSPAVSMWQLRPTLSVARVVVAGAIVALFGGFLLAGLLSEPSDRSVPAAVSPTPTPTSDVLPGVDLVTEELAPGVFRIVDGRSPMLGALLGDGTMSPRLRPDISLTFGHDGNVWVFYRHGFFRLGGERVHLWPGYSNDSVACPEGRSCHEVAPDGTIWTSGQDEDGRAVLRSYDGVAWTEHVLPFADPNARAASIEVEVLVDGSVWALAQADGWSRLARLDADGWVDLGPLPSPAVPGSFHVTDAGDAWIGPSDDPPDTLYVRRAEAGTWQEDRPQLTITQSSLTVDPGGRAWVGHGGMDWELGRRDERGWAEWGTADGVPMRNNYRGIQELTVASPDGTVWLSPTDNAWASITTDPGCGLGNFDGDRLTVILEAVCFGALDIAPDGTVWALGERRRQGGALYVITPEGVMAARSSPRTQGAGVAGAESDAPDQGGEGGSP